MAIDDGADTAASPLAIESDRVEDRNFIIVFQLLIRIAKRRRSAGAVIAASLLRSAALISSATAAFFLSRRRAGISSIVVAREREQKSRDASRRDAVLAAVAILTQARMTIGKCRCDFCLAENLSRRRATKNFRDDGGRITRHATDEARAPR